MTAAAVTAGNERPSFITTPPKDPIKDENGASRAIYDTLVSDGTWDALDQAFFNAHAADGGLSQQDTDGAQRYQAMKPLLLPLADINGDGNATDAELNKAYRVLNAFNGGGINAATLQQLLADPEKGPAIRALLKDDGLFQQVMAGDGITNDERRALLILAHDGSISPEDKMLLPRLTKFLAESRQVSNGAPFFSEEGLDQDLANALADGSFDTTDMDNLEDKLTSRRNLGA